MPPLSHPTSCTPTKSNLHLANSLATAVSESDLYRLLTFQVLNLMPLFHCFCHAKVSVQVRGTCICFITKPVFTVRSCQHLAQPPSWRTTPCRPSATAYSIYSQLPSVLETVPPSATPGRSVPWWQGPADYGYLVYHCVFFKLTKFCSTQTLGARKTSYATVWYNMKYLQLFWGPPIGGNPCSLKRCR